MHEPSVLPARASLTNHPVLAQDGRRRALTCSFRAGLLRKSPHFFWSKRSVKQAADSASMFVERFTIASAKPSDGCKGLRSVDQHDGIATSRVGSLTRMMQQQAQPTSRNVLKRDISVWIHEAEHTTGGCRMGRLALPGAPFRAGRANACTSASRLLEGSYQFSARTPPILWHRRKRASDEGPLGGRKHRQIGFGTPILSLEAGGVSIKGKRPPRSRQ
jgi:hypothetical protein